MDRLPELADGRLLDVGGGPGANLLALADRRPGWWGVAIDPSPSLVAAAARRHPAVRAEVVALPFGSGRFEGIVAGHVVQDLAADPGRLATVAAELARVCAAGGRVLVVLDGARHLAALRSLVDEAAGGRLLGGADRPTFEEWSAALAPHLVVDHVDVLTDEIVVRTAGPVLTYVRSLRVQVEPRLRGFTGMTMVLARVRASLEETLARDGHWSTPTETGVLVCHPA